MQQQLLVLVFARVVARRSSLVACRAQKNDASTEEQKANFGEAIVLTEGFSCLFFLFSFVLIPPVSQLRLGKFVLK